jgi:RNA polymerase sigma-70 factor, ECF subfamily
MTQSFRELLESAQAGNQVAIGQILENHRRWLGMLVSQRVPAAVKPRIGDSDVVQQTILSALRAFPEFDGKSLDEFQRWLRLIHERNLLDTIRYHKQSQKRAAGAERRHDDFAGGGHAVAAGKESSPSNLAVLSERAMQLNRALDRLPADQREAIRLRHIEGKSLQEIQDFLGRSQDACAGLIKRGLRTMRSILDKKL